MFAGRASVPDWEAKVAGHFLQQLEQPGARERVASLNQVANQKLCDSQLVRFRGSGHVGP